jgi:hypothetical protein
MLGDSQRLLRRPHRKAACRCLQFPSEVCTLRNLSAGLSDFVTGGFWLGLYSVWMDQETKLHLIELFQALKAIEERTRKLSVSVKALVAATTHDPETFDRYMTAFSDEESRSNAGEESLAIEQIHLTIQAMLASHTGQA